jgi:hypothetical protein
MASFTSYPPIVHHPSASRPLSYPAAHEILSTFLHLANLDPAYRPDSTLTERGPQSNSSAGNPNLTLHHLNRIKLGLEGTNLGIEDLGADFFGQKKRVATTEDRERGAENKKRKWQDRDAVTTPVRAVVPEVISTVEEDVEAAVTAQNTNNARDATAAGQGWQDREDFELAQDDEDVDVNNAQRDPAAAEMEEMPDEILEGKTGRMINVDEELEMEDGAAEIVRAADVIDKQEEKSNAVSRALSKEEKAERKWLKQQRAKEDRVTAKKVKSKEEHGEPSRLAKAQNKESEETSLLKKKKKQKKSKVEG